jgi:hypothetical protein
VREEGEREEGEREKEKRERELFFQLHNTKEREEGAKRSTTPTTEIDIAYGDISSTNCCRDALSKRW